MRSKTKNDKPVCEVYANGDKEWYINKLCTVISGVSCPNLIAGGSFRLRP